jgi:hypothetical protein
VTNEILFSRTGIRDIDHDVVPYTSLCNMISPDLDIHQHQDVSFVTGKIILGLDDRPRDVGIVMCGT